jgi:hypothetical protein
MTLWILKDIHADGGTGIDVRNTTDRKKTYHGRIFF